jgi:hypothetical protein
MRFAVIALLATALLTGCGAAQDCPEVMEQPATIEGVAGAAAAAGFPEFIREQLSSPHALRAKLYIAPDGKVRKYAVYLAEEGVPAWVPEMADQELGQGEDVEFEAEQYENGDQVYEVTRVVDGQKKELSVKLDKTVKYVETPIGPDALPAPVKAAVEGVSGFTPELYLTKKGPDLEVYQVKGEKDGKSYRLDLAADGSVTSQSRELDAGLVVDVEPQ